jgi:hypothetical protein
VEAQAVIVLVLDRQAVNGGAVLASRHDPAQVGSQQALHVPRPEIGNQKRFSFLSFLSSI